MTRRYRGLQNIIETFFYLQRSKILFLGLFCIKFKVKVEVAFWNRRFCCSERPVCYIKRQKRLWHRNKEWSQGVTGGTIGYKGLQEVTGGYKGLQGVKGGYKGLKGVTGGYKGLRAVTKCYKGLQGVTKGDKALQGFTKDYRNFFLTRTFPDTFSWSILHENQSWRNLKFLTKQWTNPFAKILILRFSYTLVFIVFKGIFFI